ncbi:hypothetical protein LEP1GSC132_2500 [Leptospira kirschneri str. 200803703]|uniref:hypothetical protein n=1 Tax=Leptospira kirschneri TaxID=29507 RepID=UPI0002BF5CEE|nr:hypothetical protein [Leptospira kirschneri]EMO66433.1 hypothetical protein LEP1GSC132_2500 [Leptospira kirschneri str. 200803703]
MIKLEGFDEFQKKLNKIKKIKEIQEISLLELFSEEFITEYTNYSTLEEMLKRSGFIIESEEDFKELEKSKDWDTFVSQNTKFKSWKEMFDKAFDIYINQVLDN